MGNIYIKFKDERTRNLNLKPKTRLRQAFEKSVIKILKAITPNANPDFDDKIDEVSLWLIEINEETGDAEREIGINEEGQTILIMPFNRNFGFWTDNTYKLNDFVECFGAVHIDNKEFYFRWDRFENGYSS